MPSQLELEWRQSCAKNPPDTMRFYIRQWCDLQLRHDPEWRPRGGLVRLLKCLGIASEYVKITPHVFITVRLPRTMEIKEAYGKIKDLKYGWLQDTRAVIEGYGTPNPHCHLLVAGSPHKGNCIKQLANRFGIDRVMVDFKRSDDPELWATRVAYVEGTKVNEKVEKVEADIAYRNANNIPHLIKF